jgi:hypothetical protein
MKVFYGEVTMEGIITFTICGDLNIYTVFFWGTHLYCVCLLYNYMNDFSLKKKNYMNDLFILVKLETFKFSFSKNYSL